MREWQPIETAPKDGSAILLAGPFEHGCIIAFWSDPSIGDTEPSDSGWYEFEWSGNPIHGQPTHWSPIPNIPPTVDGSPTSPPA